MTDDDAILNSPALYSEEEVLAEFQAGCEAEAEEPGQPHRETEACCAGSLPDVRSSEPSSPGEEELIFNRLPYTVQSFRTVARSVIIKIRELT